MILPAVRASFGHRDALHLVELLGCDDRELRHATRARLGSEGLDSLLDALRVALNRLSDRYLWPGGADPVGRLLRDVSSRPEAP